MRTRSLGRNNDRPRRYVVPVGRPDHQFPVNTNFGSFFVFTEGGKDIVPFSERCERRSKHLGVIEFYKVRFGTLDNKVAYSVRQVINRQVVGDSSSLDWYCYCA